jgi:hypothetical protein
MPCTVADFHDLVRLLEEHPDWRTELRRVLFSQDLLHLLRTVQELAVAQRHTEEAIARLTERMERGFTEAATERRELRQDLTRLEDRVDQGFAEATDDRQRIRDRMEQGFAAAADQRDIRRDIGQLKGLGQEQFYRDRAAATFGRLLVQGYDSTNQIADLLGRSRFISHTLRT